MILIRFLLGKSQIFINLPLHIHAKQQAGPSFLVQSPLRYTNGNAILRVTKSA